MNDIISDVVLKEYINHYLSKPTENELEMRFGNFIYDKTTNKNNFQSGVEISFYYNIKKNLQNNNVPYKKIDTVEYIYRNNQGKGNIKKITELNKEPIYMLKNLYKKYNIYEYDFRMAMSSEKILKYNYIKGVDFNKPDFVRQKSRLSFDVNFGKIDLTIVHENNTMTPKYEVEFEIKVGDVNLVKSALEYFLKIRQENNFLISNTEKRKLFNGYKELTGMTYFIGVQPENLQRDQINILYKELYSVTDKADGDRFFLYIYDKKVYFLDNNLNNFIKTDIVSTLYDSVIIDGELVKRGNEFKFLAFDLLAYNGKDIRGDDNYYLKERLNRLYDILKSLNTSEYYKIEMKKFIYRNVFLGGEILLELAKKKEYENDGLIFTPMNESYPKMKKWTKLLKWKPGDMNTIDFYAVKRDNYWELYVQHMDTVEGSTDIIRNKQKYENTLVLFDIEKLCGTKTELMTYRTEFDDNEYRDPITEEPYVSNTVIEFKFNKEKQKFIPMRTRWDKTMNTKKHGNYSSVACDIWKNIENPITKEFLLSFNNSQTQNEAFFFDSMRNFHNRIKEYLYNKYCHNNEYLLEICSGKGGDLYKWYHNNINNVIGYDNNGEAIKEAARRMSGLMKKYNKSLNYKFYEIDLRKDKFHDDQIYNSIACQFGLHYFYENEQTILFVMRQVYDHLDDNGYFIATFMDDTRVREMNNRYMIRNGELLYYLKSNFFNINYGNNVNMYLNGDNYMSNTNTNEYIINWKLYCELMMGLGFTLVESETFDKMYKNEFKLDDYEREISFLYRYSVWSKSVKKVEHNTFDVPKNESLKVNDISYINYEKYKLNFVRVKNTYDIITLLNTISVRYNYHEYENIEFGENNFNEVIQQLQVCNGESQLYFYYYKYIPESEEERVYHNWYIITRDNKLFSSQKDIIYIKECLDSVQLKSVESQDFDKLTIKELKEILRERGLRVSGNKSELIERLRN